MGTTVANALARRPLSSLLAVAARLPALLMMMMMMMMMLVCTAAAASQQDSSSVCPKSPAYVHAKCEMSVQFENSCSQVFEEIMARLTDESWIDPHNAGKYTLLDSHHHDHVDSNHDSSEIQASRTSGGQGLYTDLLGMRLVDQKNNDGTSTTTTCVLSACSESQVTSILDFSTNYCNLHNLYCGTNENCRVLKHDLAYRRETFESCWQRDVSKCIVETDSE
jgi:hypothetical protein